jgi:hypothetical protein
MADETHDLADAEAEAQAEAERSVAPPAARRRRQGAEPTDQASTAVPPTDVTPEVATALAPVTGAPSENLSLAGSGVDSVQARNVTITRGGAGRVDATDVAVSQGGIGAARADRVFVELGGLGAAMAGEVNVTQGYLGPTIAREVHLDQAFARSVVAANASFGPRSGAFLVVAARVNGNVRPVLDWRGGLALGAAFGLVAGLVRLRRSR